MSTRPTQLIVAASRELIDATLITELPATELVLIQDEWDSHKKTIRRRLQDAGVPPEQWPESLHWDWANKVESLKTLAVQAAGIRVGDSWQAVMITNTVKHVARHEQDRGKPLVYVEYLETAPWNWDVSRVGATGRYRGCGTALIREAVLQSFREEFSGRVGLHALPQSERFYEGCKMTPFGPDGRKDDLVYFEFSRESAKKFKGA